MNESAPQTARSISRGAFFALFLIPCVLTYIVGWITPLLGFVTAGSGFFLAKIVLVGLYVWMAAASFLRGAANGRQWAVVFPIFAGVFDVFLVFLPFVPSVFNVIALVVGAGGGRPAGGESAPAGSEEP